MPYRRWLDHNNPAIVANALICLIHQANYLLDRQIQALERDFINEGGYSEQLAAARVKRREQDRTDPTDPTDPSDLLPACPLCGAVMALRTAKRGPRAGAQFLGCTKYPDCKGTRQL